MCVCNPIFCHSPPLRRIYIAGSHLTCSFRNCFCKMCMNSLNCFLKGFISFCAFSWWYIKHCSTLLLSSQVICLYFTFVVLPIAKTWFMSFTSVPLHFLNMFLCYFLPIYSSCGIGAFVLVPAAILSPGFAEAVVRRKTLTRLNLGDL